MRNISGLARSRFDAGFLMDRQRNMIADRRGPRSARPAKKHVVRQLGLELGMIARQLDSVSACHRIQERSDLSVANDRRSHKLMHGIPAMEEPNDRDQRRGTGPRYRMLGDGKRALVRYPIAWVEEWRVATGREGLGLGRGR
jgi:hypothetical protein